MSDTIEKKPEDTSSAVVAPVTSMLQQVLGGPAGNPQAIAEAAKGADKDVYSKLASSVAEAAANSSAFFNAGVAATRAATSSPASMADTAQKLGELKSSATGESGRAAANAGLLSDLAAAAKNVQDQKQVIQLGMEPGSPAVIAQNKAIQEHSAEAVTRLNRITDMNKVDFLSSPGDWIVNHFINIPWEKARVSEEVGYTKQAVDTLSAQSIALGIRTVVDGVVNNPNTADMAVEKYKQTLAAANALGIDPLREAQNMKLGAWNLGVNQADSALRKQADAREAALLPGRLAQQRQDAALFPGIIKLQEQEIALGAGRLNLQTEQLNYYAAAKNESSAKTDALIADLKERTATALRNNQADADALASLNKMMERFGSTTPMTTVKGLASGVVNARTEMASNLAATGTFAQTAADVSRLITNSGLPLNKLPAGHQVTANNLAQTLRDATEEVERKIAKDPMTFSKLTPEAKRDMITGAMQQKLQEESNDGWSHSNRYFTLPTIGGILENPAFKNNPIIQSLTPLSVDGSGNPVGRQLDGTTLMNQTARLVLDGKLSENDAVRYFQDFATKWRDSVGEGYGYGVFNVPQPKDFNLHYNLSRPMISNSGAKVNALDTTDLLTKLRLQVSGLKTAEMTKDAKDMLQ